MKTILMTALGSMAASPVMARFHQLHYRVVGCDIYDRTWNAASSEADAFFQSRPASEGESYLRQLREAVEKYEADYLIPLTDPEVDLLCDKKRLFANLGCVLCTPEERVTRLCRDKERMTAFLASAHLCATIPTFDPYHVKPDQSDFPLLLKPRSGRSSQGLAKVKTPTEYQAALLTRRDYICQPYLTGPVWTVDVARDQYGNALTAVRKELLRNPSGLGMTVTVVPEHPLNSLCRAIADYVGIVGTVNMEFIQHDDQYYFLEVNPRFSGGVGFSIQAGADFPKQTLRCCEGAALEPRHALRALTMTRRSDVMITYENPMGGEIEHERY